MAALTEYDEKEVQKNEEKKEVEEKEEVEEEEEEEEREEGGGRTLWAPSSAQGQAHKVKGPDCAQGCWAHKTHRVV